MGRGSSKNERKVNAHRSAIEKAREKELRDQIKVLTSLPFFRRDANYSRALDKLRGMLNKCLARQKRSENDTQAGKRGRK
jgi:hypothetical protein